jgi:hypothetical protein
MESEKGPVWPIILGIVLIYIVAALVEPCDGGCIHDEVTHVSR